MITTPRLRLVPAAAELLHAELAGPPALSALLGAVVPDSWPPELYDENAIRFTLEQLEQHPDEVGWWLHYFIADEAGVPHVVGCGGYKGPPTDGCVEIGYSILEQFRRRGYASEATEGLCAHAFAQPGVDRVIAETLPELVPSIGVLERCGFTLTGEGSEPGVIRFELAQPRALGSGLAP